MCLIKKLKLSKSVKGEYHAVVIASVVSLWPLKLYSPISNITYKVILKTQCLLISHCCCNNWYGPSMTSSESNILKDPSIVLPTLYLERWGRGGGPYSSVAGDQSTTGYPHIQHSLTPRNTLMSPIDPNMHVLGRKPCYAKEI